MRDIQNAINKLAEVRRGYNNLMNNGVALKSNRLYDNGVCRSCGAPQAVDKRVPAFGGCVWDETPIGVCRHSGMPHDRQQE